LQSGDMTVLLKCICAVLIYASEVQVMMACLFIVVCCSSLVSVS